MADSVQTKSAWSYLADFENLCDEYLVRKAPSLPSPAKEVIVKFGPWVLAIALIPWVLSVLSMLALSPFAYLGGVQSGFDTLLFVIFNIVLIVMTVIALPGLFKQLRKGWTMMFYVSLVEMVYNLAGRHFVELILGALISLYFLFQVKNYYK